MSIAQLAAKIGKVGEFRTRDGLTMTVSVVDARSAYGVDRLVISDTHGHTITVDADRVEVAS
jgi:hypothetical protein